MNGKKYRVSVVSYTNTLPFKVALEEDAGILKYADLSYDNPAVCAQKIITNESDIGLIPVGAFPSLKTYQIISDYCIGADGLVETVKLYGKVPLNEMKSIYLDPQSRTSVNLVKVLALKFWGIDPEFKNGQNGFENQVNSENDGFVLIGDRTFNMKGQYAFEYDLAEQWKIFTGLPFVFAAWVANKPIDNAFVERFNQTLQKGILMIPQIAEDYRGSVPDNVDLGNYLSNCISFSLDAKKKEAMRLFLDYMQEL
jgi:chorismate dehydratase